MSAFLKNNPLICLKSWISIYYISMLKCSRCNAEETSELNQSYDHTTERMGKTLLYSKYTNLIFDETESKSK